MRLSPSVLFLLACFSLNQSNADVLAKHVQAGSTSRQSVTSHSQQQERGARLGVHIARLPQPLARQLNVPSGVGFLVKEVLPGTPAEKAGLQTHDVLVKLGDQWLINGSQLMVLLNMQRPGQAAELSFYRKGEMLKAPLILTNLPPEPDTVPTITELLERNNSALKIADPSARNVSVDYAGGKVQLEREMGEYFLMVLDDKGRVTFRAPVNNASQMKDIPAEYAQFIPVLKRTLENFQPRRRPRIIRPNRPASAISGK